MGDLPDFTSQVETGVLQASSFINGADASKPASPAVGDIYLATDTLKLYICIAAGAWTGFDAAILVQGTLTLYANMVASSKKITGLAAPTDANDAARKTDVDAMSLGASVSSVSRSVDTTYQNTSGNVQLITITAGLDDGEIARVKVGSGTPPSTTRVEASFNPGVGGDEQKPMTFIVPDQWYWLFETTVGTPTIDRCVIQELTQS